MRNLLVVGTHSGAIGAILVSIFFCMFMTLIWWVFRRGSKAGYEELSRMPFEESDKQE